MLRLFVLALRDRAGHDARARVHVSLAVLEDRASDRDGRVEVAVIAEIPDRPAVQPAALAFGRRDELHGADLGSAGQRAGREDRAQRVEGIELRPQPRLHMRDEMEDVAVALDLHVLADRDGPGPGHAPQVVAAQIDQHDVLGPLLRVLLELFGQPRVLPRIGTAWARARDRVGRQPVALHLEEQLRRRADDLERGRADEEQVRAGVDAPKRAVQPDAIQRRPGGGIGRQIERLATSQYDLDGLPGRDGVLGDLDRVDVGVAAQARLDGAPERRRSAIHGRSSDAGELARARSRGPLQRLEDRGFGDPVAALQVPRLRVE